MSDEAALWRLEREFWLGGAEVGAPERRQLALHHQTPISRVEP